MNSDLGAFLGQTVIVPNSAAVDVVLPRLADSLQTVLQQHKQVAEHGKRAESTTPHAALICLACRRCDVPTRCSATAPTTATPNKLRSPVGRSAQVG
ncbi:hypothetical protein [Actinokineospora sp. NBRC 105648]|uniref:hypothetical protein n=1 Tax=Actinokineospora sp. NBRC 105648 TaxID=3032206 RepID=UPI0025577F01|nr:hypothetical protein [Actinokineospora sp. NBRC 105648]